ncbi:conserved exported hypothetical protein [Candidatus Desulfosporosinus infrequens]|uniref:Uncharacterized protein n=1 Tax=Candidatus Desulfosporosinus infrequens TaxID=2043169 RepID=A0A2U3KV36_9FIRM|nr:conserved exported hypothetical protein [Candidatus Desulfosporosinus infrequens]
MLRLKNDERGLIALPVLMIFLLVMILAIGFVGVALKLMAAQRADFEVRAQSLLKDSIQTAINIPLPQGIETNNADLESNVLQLYAQKLPVPVGNLAVQNFTVYTDADADSPAPPGISGTISGSSVYVSLQVTWTMPPVLGISYTGTYPVCDLVSIPTYFAAGQQFN